MTAGGAFAPGTILLARADRTGQTAVIDAVGRVPQRLSQLDSLAEDFDLFVAARGCIGGCELLIQLGDKIFVVSVTQDGFENVFALTH
mgnify:CR=1 FL=1